MCSGRHFYEVHAVFPLVFLVGCIMSLEDPKAPIAPSFLKVQTVPDGRLMFTVGNDTVYSPALVRVPRGALIPVAMPSPQFRDLDSALAGLDTRYDFAAWLLGSARADTAYLSRLDTGLLIASIRKSYRVRVFPSYDSAAELPGSGWYRGDSILSLVPADTVG